MQQLNLKKERLMCNMLIITMLNYNSSQEEQRAARGHELHVILAPKETAPNCDCLRLSYSERKAQHAT